MRHPGSNILQIKIKTIDCNKLISICKIWRKPVIWCISYSIMRKLLSFITFWSTVSKAFFKSINTVQTDFLFSNDFSISSISLIIWWTVEKFFWKPNCCFWYKILCPSRNCITLFCVRFSMILSTLDNNEIAL